MKHREPCTDCLHASVPHLIFLLVTLARLLLANSYPLEASVTLIGQNLRRGLWCVVRVRLSPVAVKPVPPLPVYGVQAF